MDDALAESFEAHRSHLRSVAYRMLGSLADADDAVQESWLRLSRADTGEVRNLGGWLTTVVGRVCLDMLRSRRAHPEEPLLPDPVVTLPSSDEPEDQVLLADSVGLALLVVLESLGPAERLAFVLHDMFALSFEEIAPIVGRSVEATRKLASRARRRVREGSVPQSDLRRQRAVADAFLAATRSGDLSGLLAILDPLVVLRADTGKVRIVRGAREVAGGALLFSRITQNVVAVPVTVNGSAGLLSVVNGRVRAVMGFTVVDGLIVEIDILVDPKRLAALDLPPV